MSVFLTGSVSMSPSGTVSMFPSVLNSHPDRLCTVDVCIHVRNFNLQQQLFSHYRPAIKHVVETTLRPHVLKNIMINRPN